MIKTNLETYPTNIFGSRLLPWTVRNAALTWCRLIPPDWLLSFSVKNALNLKTDLAGSEYLEVSNKTVSSWRAKNSIPLEFLLQACAETGEKIDYFLFGEALQRQQSELIEPAIDDFRIKTMKLTGERILMIVSREVV